ncbi:hypothetical protein DFH07DRAFT_925148 [Mycena maculata]|uniref:Uncharacterized protein n=1 Tax=Mycena maculata TaxID=230809 RepID=A0AAD7IJ32_9AGAR|nr:hypothetical protein DFH07DRAFT_925148 [Mycena maculata]
MLYEEGILVETPEHPDGIRVRVALVAIIADHPAMCKLCGFADHGHKAVPCTKCTVSHDELFTEKSLRNEFPARSGEEHRRLAKEYRDISDPQEKEDFFTIHGVKWTEFARLYYFDLVRYTIIDPMHNLLLGVAKTQWYTRWIQNGSLRGNTPNSTRELGVIHEFLETFESPLWAGRLPLRVGEPAGGSLTADEYKFAVTGPWAVVIPLIWDRFLSESDKDFKAASARYPEAMKVYEAKRKAWERGNKKSAPPKPPKVPIQRMQKGEERNFLRFATALKILVGSSIRTDGLDRAVGLLRDYLLNFSKLYGIEQMKPNHHWAVHIPDQVLDYGPLYSFWAFLTERLNKVLKNLNSNNWSGGLLEVSMMREFHHMAQLDGVLNGILDETSGPDVPLPSQLEHRFIQLLLGAGKNKEALGTIQDAAAYERTSSRVLRGSIANPSERIEDDVLRMGLVQYYNKETPKVYLRLAGKEFANTEVLGSFTETYNYALLDGRRVTSTTCSERGSAGSSLIQIQFGGEPYAGEIRSIFRHKQAGVPSSEAMLLVFVAWMKPSGETPLDDDSFIWHDFPELGVDTWIYKEYAQPGDTDCPPCVMPLADIQCQVSRGTIRYTEPPLWITTTMDRVSLKEVSDYFLIHLDSSQVRFRRMGLVTWWEKTNELSTELLCDYVREHYSCDAILYLATFYT